MAAFQVSQFTGISQHFQLEPDLMDKTTLWTLIPSVWDDFYTQRFPWFRDNMGLGPVAKKKKKSNYIYKQLGQINSENTL